MKVVDDKLKIIDDVPNSAVEMAVKEKVNSYHNLFFLLENIFFAVFEESSETGQNCRGSKTYFEASLQRQKNNKGVVQRNSQKSGPQGENQTFVVIEQLFKTRQNFVCSAKTDTAV